MKTAMIIAALALVTTAATAQTTTPGYDRPSTDREHQQVVYWNDSMVHYDVDVQHAADAWSTDDIINKNDRKANKNYDRWHKAKKATGS